jgi:phosphocarrier protein HPr
MRESDQKNTEIAEPNGALRKCLVVNNERGLNARAAAMLVKLEKAFDAQLFLECGGCQVNARSIMQILSLDAARGAQITVCADGPDAEAMLQAVEKMFAEGFVESAPVARHPVEVSAPKQNPRT